MQLQDWECKIAAIDSWQPGVKLAARTRAGVISGSQADEAYDALSEDDIDDYFNYLEHGFCVNCIKSGEYYLAGYGYNEDLCPSCAVRQ